LQEQPALVLSLSLDLGLAPGLLWLSILNDGQAADLGMVDMSGVESSEVLGTQLGQWVAQRLYDTGFWE
jgi:hypothetical protein